MEFDYNFITGIVISVIAWMAILIYANVEFDDGIVYPSMHRLVKVADVATVVIAFITICVFGLWC